MRVRWVQQSVLALIAANPDGVWATEDLCLAAYPHTGAAMKMGESRRSERRDVERVVALRAERAKLTAPGI